MMISLWGRIVRAMSELSTPAIKKLLISRGQSPIGKRSELLVRLSIDPVREKVQMILFTTGASIFGRNQCGIYFHPSLKEEIRTTLDNNRVKNKLFNRLGNLYFETEFPIQTINDLFPSHSKSLWTNYHRDFVSPDMILEA